jgi:uracil-DNA glycosylase family 4
VEAGVQSIDQTNSELEALLDFYLASGIDCVLGEEAANRFEEPAAAKEARAPRVSPVPGQGSTNDPRSRAVPDGGGEMMRGSPSGPSPIRPDAEPAVVLPNASAIDSAREAAREAANLDELRACLEQFEGCNLRLTAKNLVFADGNPQARVMFVGEAPGRDEDIQGVPFVGRSGQLLDRMLSAIGLDRSSVYIANVVPWRPPGNRTPSPQETEICKPFILRQIELVRPDVLVFLGSASAKTLLGTQDGIRKMRGRWMKFETGGVQIDCLATYHPAYLLRSPIEKRLSWRDFMSIRKKLDS